MKTAACFHEYVYNVQALAIHGFAIEIIKAEPLLADQSAFCKRLVSTRLISVSVCCACCLVQFPL